MTRLLSTNTHEGYFVAAKDATTDITGILGPADHGGKRRRAVTLGCRTTTGVPGSQYGSFGPIEKAEDVNVKEIHHRE